MKNEKPRFWELSSPESRRGRAEWVDDEITLREDLPPCPVDPEHSRIFWRESDLSVLLTSKRFTDFIWTWYSECMIQDHVLEMFRNEGFTGFEVRPVKARMKRRALRPDPCEENPGVYPWTSVLTRVPTLWEIVVTGWGGLAHPDSGMKIIERCPSCGLLTYNLLDNPSKMIDESQWDGSDFFQVYLGGDFVSDRVAEFIRKHKLTGVRLIAPSDIELVEFATSVRSAISLRWRFPDDRAHELGDPLGIY